MLNSSQTIFTIAIFNYGFTFSYQAIKNQILTTSFLDAVLLDFDNEVEINKIVDMINKSRNKTKPQPK
ncbi:hypothetical protein AEM51_11915 [Bacteroidetes bacterium UKL13-3]|jgi:hypothetical protein|nr:hypothetical protein AEM51_11915 [Bacteroidetes bacterium UKL13-3]HCP93591.1 hypothetical protein [Bacteroidota bacterium]